MSQVRHTYFLFIGLLLSCNKLFSQDPNYSQFFTSPLTISPALAGNGDDQWRITSTLRNQSIGIGANYNTRTIAADGKIYNNPQTLTYIGLGGLLMMEDAADGAYKSNYMSINGALHIALDQSDWIHGLTVGLGLIYNKTTINVNDLSTGQQLYSMGFNRSLPTADPAVKNIPGAVSMCAGIVYNFTTDDMLVDVGVAGYRFYNTKQSVFEDASQFTSPRYNAHFSINKLLNRRLNVTTNGLYQIQNNVQGFTAGGHFGFAHSDDEESPRIFNIGAYYRVGDALIPYLGYIYNDFQFGITYDVQVSQQKTGSVTPNSLEISLIYRHSRASRNPLLW